MITIIVPVYKVEKYLDRCVESILAQTYTDFELILVDDGSPDRCPAMCDAWAEKDNRIRVIHKENGGLSSARNAGLDAMQGDYVTFIDSDDAVKNNYLERLLTVLLNNHAEVCVCALKQEGEKDIPPCNSIVLTGEEACMEIYRPLKNDVAMVISCAKLYKKECFDFIRFPIGKIHEDQYTTYKILFHCNNIVKTKDKLYCYTSDNINSITHSSFSIKRYDDLYAIDEAIQFYKQNNKSDLLIAAQERKAKIQAEYSFQARKSKIYSKIPKQYRISQASAWKILENSMDNDRFEYYMSQYHPKAIKLRAYKRKLLSYFSKNR